MTRVPTIYSEWLVSLQEFKEGLKDEETIVLMEKGTIEWSRGVAERLTQRLYETIDLRLRKSADQFQKELNHSQGNHTAIVNAIVTLRKRLAIIKRVADLPAFPEQVNEAMNNLLFGYAENTQKSLEDSAQSDRTGHLRMLIKNNAITQFDQVENIFGSVATSEPMAVSNTSNIGRIPKRRRVILFE